MLHCALPQHAAFVAFLYIVKPDVYILLSLSHCLLLPENCSSL